MRRWLWASPCQAVGLISHAPAPTPPHRAALCLSSLKRLMRLQLQPLAHDRLLDRPTAAPTPTSPPLTLSREMLIPFLPNPRSTVIRFASLARTGSINTISATGTHSQKQSTANMNPPTVCHTWSHACRKKKPWPRNSKTPTSPAKGPTPPPQPGNPT